MEKASGHYHRGFTILELILVMAVIAIITAIAAPALMKLKNDTADASQQIVAAAQETRIRAIQNTSAARMVINTKGITIQTALTCSTTPSSGWTTVGTQELPERTTLTPLPWNLCFTSRGLTTPPSDLSITDRAGHTAKVTVYLTGQTEVKP